MATWRDKWPLHNSARFSFIKTEKHLKTQRPSNWSQTCLFLLWAFHITHNIQDLPLVLCHVDEFFPTNIFPLVLNIYQYFQTIYKYGLIWFNADISLIFQPISADPTTQEPVDKVKCKISDQRMDWIHYLPGSIVVFLFKYSNILGFIWHHRFIKQFIITNFEKSVSVNKCYLAEKIRHFLILYNASCQK